MPSKVVLETVKKSIAMLKELKVPVLGVVENMKTAKSSSVSEQMKKLNVPFLGEIRFDEGLEDSLGNAGQLLRTEFARDLKRIVLATPGFGLKK